MPNGRNEILELNLRKVIRCLKPIISPGELAKIETELRGHVARLMRLARAHLQFAKKSAGPQSWRQRVSRAYYCAYSASKAVRLEKTGIYSADATDHKKIGELPDDFPALGRWQDILTKFRADRNIADYDHSAMERNLELTSAQYADEAEKFFKEARRYLKSQGAT